MGERKHGQIGDRPGLESAPPAPQRGICMQSPASPLSHPGMPTQVPFIKNYYYH